MVMDWLDFGEKGSLGVGGILLGEQKLPNQPSIISMVGGLLLPEQ
jgi:hypothetical protein